MARSTIARPGAAKPRGAGKARTAPATRRPGKAAPAAAPRRSGTSTAAVGLRLAEALEAMARATDRLAQAIEAMPPPLDPEAAGLGLAAERLALAGARPSGVEWCERFPTSRSLEDLAEPFGAACRRFVAALRTAGATVTVNATNRPRERAYLMHWSWQVAKNQLDPRRVPPMAGVDIAWAHLDPDGGFDVVASRGAAQEMVRRYGIVFMPALASRHTQRRAVDMTIAWQGALALARAEGGTARIEDGPRDGANPALHAVGRGYGVVKLVSDPPHWSDDGH